MTQAAVTPITSKPDEKDKIVWSTIAQSSHIATLPEITVSVMRIVKDPNSTAQDLNNIISNDPAMGARILKVVNSSFYGVPGQIGSINRAIVLLGLNAVKNIAIAASLAKLFGGGQICPAFDARTLWTHCIAVASATHTLSAKIGIGLADEAFLAGLIHDLGIMVEMQAHRNKLIETIDKIEHDNTITFRRAESESFGANHEDFGAALCKAWKLPLRFAQVTGYHHRPLELAANKRTLVSLVHIGDILAAKLNIGYSRTVETTEIHPELMDQLKLTQEIIDHVIEELPESTEQIRAMLML